MERPLPSQSAEPDMLCDFEAKGAGLQCRSCGRVLENWTGKAPFARCHQKPRPPAAPPIPMAGPGTELKSLLARIGITAKPGCKCNARAREMDKRGCDWCEQNLDTISEWLAEEAKARHLPYSHVAGKQIVRLAIHRARKKMSGSHGTQT